MWSAGRAQSLTCGFGSARVGQASIGLSAISSCKLQAHPRFRLIFPSRLRWSLSYSMLKKKRGMREYVANLETERKATKSRKCSPTDLPLWSRGNRKGATAFSRVFASALVTSLCAHATLVIILPPSPSLPPHLLRAHSVLCKIPKSQKWIRHSFCPQVTYGL